MTLGDGSFNITAGGGVTESVSRDFDLAQMPEGMERPSREHMAQMPEGTERPSRGDMPQMPEGAELPDIENMPQRGQMGDKGQWGMKPDRQWGNESTSDTSTESMKGIKAGGVLTVNGGVYSISSADDCLHSNTDLKVLGGEFTLSSDDDAFHADSNLLFADGNVNVITSYEALEGESIDIKGGSFTLVSSDDGLNAAGGADQSGFGKRGDMFGSTNSYINISGGNITLNANGDGIDSNGSLTVSGGDILVLGPLSGGDAPVDWQMSGEITGGTVIAVGNSSMAMNFTKATQCSVFIALDSYVESGKSFQLMDSDGNVVLEKIVDKRYNCILVSTPDMKENGSYTLVTEAAEHPFTLDGYTYSNKIGGFGGGFGGRGQKNIA